ncbi:MAG: SIS domain-containing protein [Zetaproteobacteria bacterium]|nr:SIS domain-containing protein [Zetaproteobacteria bacterium]
MATIHPQQVIQSALEEGVLLRQSCIQVLDQTLMDAAHLMVKSLQAGHKILACGNGGSAADAQHFAGELVNRFECNRPALAAIALTHDASVITSIANDFCFDVIFSRQVEALGREGDILLAISTSGNSKNVINAVDAAAHHGMKVIAVTGGGGGVLGAHDAVDIHLNINHPSTPRVQEMHITCLHILCTLIDQQMFPEEYLSSQSV